VTNNKQALRKKENGKKMRKECEKKGRLLSKQKKLCNKELKNIVHN
jgi:hypothetical protein